MTSTLPQFGRAHNRLRQTDAKMWVNNGQAATSSEDRSLPSIEGLRLFASLSIVASHYFQYLNWSTRGLQLAVDLFFVISGIVITMMYEGCIGNVKAYIVFVRKRVARLYPLHLVTLLFYILIGVFVWSGTVVPVDAEKYDKTEIIPNLLMVHAWSPFGRISFNYVSWSISAEFFVYLCFPLLLYIVTRGFFKGLSICMAALAIAIVLSHMIVGTELSELNWRFGILRAVPSFTFGVWLWIYRDRLADIEFSRRHASSIFAISAVALLALLIFYPRDYVLLACIYVVIASALHCDLQGRRTIASWAPISGRGYLTYSIYMLHPIMASIVISFLFPHVFGRSPEVILVAVVCAAALTYVAAYLSYRYFESPFRVLIGGKRRLKVELVILNT